MGRAPAPSMRAKAMPSAGLAALRSSLAVSMAVASFPVEQILLSCDRGRRLRQRHGPCDARVAVSRPLAWALACALAARPSRRRGVLFPGLRANLPDALHVGDLRLAPPRSPARLSAAWYRVFLHAPHESVKGDVSGTAAPFLSFPKLLRWAYCHVKLLIELCSAHHRQKQGATPPRSVVLATPELNIGRPSPLTVQKKSLRFVMARVRSHQ
jgi:hypothetical protein